MIISHKGEGSMSGACIIGKREEKIVETQKKALLSLIRTYFATHWLGDTERGSLSEFILGIERSEGGMFKSPYILGSSFALKGIPDPSLHGLREFVLNMIAALGRKHGLSSDLEKRIISAINDATPAVEAEKHQIYAEATEQMELASSVTKRSEETKRALLKQIDSVQARAAEEAAAKDAEIGELRTRLSALQEINSQLISATDGQAQSLRSLTSMSSLDDAAHLTIQLFRAVEATLEQLSSLDVATQAVRQHKDSVIRQLEVSRSMLRDVTQETWLASQVDLCLSTVGVQSRVIDAFVAKAISNDRSRSHQSQSRICKDVIADAIERLSEYERKIEGQYFKKLRPGYKKKRPVINDLIARLGTLSGTITPDGMNAHAVLTEVRGLIVGQKFKSTGGEKRLYRNGNNFKSCIDSALVLVERGLDGRVTPVSAVVSDRPIDLSLVETLDSPEALANHLSSKYKEAITGENGLPIILKSKLMAVATALDSAAADLQKMSLSVEKASRIRADFVSRMEDSYQTRRAPSFKGVDAVKDAMRVASEVGCSIQAKLRHPSMVSQAGSGSSSPSGVVVVRSRTPFSDSEMGLTRRLSNASSASLVEAGVDYGNA